VDIELFKGFRFLPFGQIEEMLFYIIPIRDYHRFACVYWFLGCCSVNIDNIF